MRSSLTRDLELARLEPKPGLRREAILASLLGILRVVADDALRWGISEGLAS